MYIVKNILKFSEEDDYQNGCVAGTAVDNHISATFTSETLSGLLEALKSFTGCDDILLKSCEERGRVDLQGHETIKGDKATGNDYAAWKNGEKKLFHVTYTAYVYKAKFYVYKAELSTLIEGY